MYGSLEEVFEYIRKKEDKEEYFLVHERKDELGYILTRASPPQKKE